MAAPQSRAAGGQWHKHLLLSPPLAFFAAFALFPLGFTIYVSLSNWSITGEHRFIGFGNYATILASDTFRQSFLNTVIFAVVTVLLQYVLGLTLALLVYRSTRGQSALRLLLLVPMMFTPVVVGFVWKTMFDPSYGPISWLFDLVGLPQVPWFSEQLPAMTAIVIADVWQWTPFMFLILFAALRSLPTAPLEAAMVDGASGRRLLFDHLLPMLLPASMTAILLRSIEAFKLFDVVYLMTGGGPGVKTSTVTLSAYFTGLRSGDLGTAAAMTTMLLIVVLIATLVLLRLLIWAGRRRSRTDDAALQVERDDVADLTDTVDSPVTTEVR
ncbi:carbohydrate ABC transporter permease [Micromonospora radicis]|uniref:Sugar ABC transporter permease n=1 Tax=Micromonospora radicis TaxID=1894971 RepID=A0A418MXK3_9ACTN|nr:sugar ABC transporter permease [Micromonospora radicis]RIV39341.1 sugar ABC transporter permease [Micromonospora radicis]